MVKVAGVDHVGLGSDFDGVPCTPAGIDSVADLPKITLALYERGYKAADLDKILGGNLMRVFGEVEKLEADPSEINAHATETQSRHVDRVGSHPWRTADR